MPFNPDEKILDIDKFVEENTDWHDLEDEILDDWEYSVSCIDDWDFSEGDDDA